MAPNNTIIARPLSAMIQALSRVGDKLFQPPHNEIEGIKPESWYSPLQPVRPIAPEGTEPRGFQYWAGQNLLWTPRADADFSAADLKQLAIYPLARICIENVKDEVGRIPFEVQLRPKPGEKKKQTAARAQGDATLIKLNKFFERPDRENDWPTWVAQIIEDMLVIDAATVLVRKTFKGEIAELPVLRGESIVRYIDTQGFTPLPPSPAYAQNWWGIPLVNLTTEQLLYRPRRIVPRNTVSSQLYGMSATEQLATEIQVGIKRLEFTLNYYTEGSIPGVVQVVPPGISPNKISEAMQWMNSELAGNLAARQQWRMVQGFQEEGKPDQIVFTKEPLLATLFDELHIRKICFGYGTSPQRLMKMIRTEGKASSDSATIEGLLPWITFIKKSIVDNLIQRYFGYPDYHGVFDPFEEVDPVKEAERVTLLFGKGLITQSEGREEIGEEPLKGPMADEPGIVTGTGFVPLDPEIHADQLETTGGDNGSVRGNDGNKSQTKPDGKPAAGESEGGKPNGKVKVLGRSGLGLATAGKANGHAQAQKAAKKLQIKASRLSIRSIVAKRDFERVMRNGLKRMGRKVATELGKLLKAAGTTLRKAEMDDWEQKLFKSLGVEFSKLPDDLEQPLTDAALSGAAMGALQVDINDQGLLDEINSVASAWARSRAAEMVGMRRDKDGKLVPNPDAKWAISETTRNDLRKLVADVFQEESPTMDEVRAMIEDAGLFSDVRASMIARTEIARAQGEGNLAAWKATDLVKTVEWQTTGDHDHGDECDEYEAEGPYAPDDVPDYPAHPNCTCVLIAGDIEEA